MRSRPASATTVRPARLALRGFTAMELMIVLLIMSITMVLGTDSIASFEANQRAERAARETLAYFRYARTLAMTTGKNAKVQIDTTQHTVAVYWMSNGSTWDATPASASMAVGGTMSMDLDTRQELVGTTFTVTPAGTTSFIYNALGSNATSATLTFTFGSKSKVLTVPSVGDPQVN